MGSADTVSSCFVLLRLLDIVIPLLMGFYVVWFVGGGTGSDLRREMTRGGRETGPEV